MKQCRVARISFFFLCLTPLVLIDCTTESALKSTARTIFRPDPPKPRQSPFQRPRGDTKGVFCTPNEKQHCLIGTWQSRSGTRKGTIEARLPRKRTIDTVEIAQFWLAEGNITDNSPQVKMLTGSVIRKSDSEIEAAAEFQHDFKEPRLTMKFTSLWDIPNDKWYGNFESRNPIDAGTFFLSLDPN
jgi:hypothetical protein